MRRDSTNRCRLRVYFGPEDDGGSAVLTQAAETQNRVTVPVGEVLSLLVEATKSNRGWVRDFEDDEITLSTDLYEVLLAYEHFSRPSA